jgi:hypothetical protein
MKRAENISNEDLIEFSQEHLFYEIWMLYHVIDMLANETYKLSKEDEENQIIFNALLESMIVHARIVLDFLYCKRLKPDDAIASDYFLSSSSWEPFLPKKSKALRAVLDRSNKEMAHLSYLRPGVSSDKRPWNIIEIKKDIKNIVNLFLDKADANLLHSDIYELCNM